MKNFVLSVVVGVLLCAFFGSLTSFIFPLPVDTYNISDGVTCANVGANWVQNDDYLSGYCSSTDVSTKRYLDLVKNDSLYGALIMLVLGILAILLSVTVLQKINSVVSLGFLIGGVLSLFYSSIIALIGGIGLLTSAVALVAILIVALKFSDKNPLVKPSKK